MAAPKTFWQLGVLALISAFPTGIVTSANPIIRVVTWNVADNGKMEDGFTSAAMDKVLGLNNLDPQNTDYIQLPDIYTIGLQEQCWQCNENDMMDIPNRFLSRLQRFGGFSVIGIEGTRESRWCEWGCSLGTHGSTFVLVIAKENVVTRSQGFHRNDGCSDKFPENDEKGVASMRVGLRSGKSVCVASSHLESRNPKTRRQCLKSFFEDAKENLQWPTACDFHFIFGDFNTRTGPNSGSSWFRPGWESQPMLETILSRDEMRGSAPFGQDDDWRGNLLDFINKVQEKTFKEMALNFPPTYKIATARDHCDGTMPCYRSDRPQSWTDRILFTNGSGLKYEAVITEVSDHYPVVAEFQLS